MPCSKNPGYIPPQQQPVCKCGLTAQGTLDTPCGWVFLLPSPEYFGRYARLQSEKTLFSSRQSYDYQKIVGATMRPRVIYLPAHRDYRRSGLRTFGKLTYRESPTHSSRSPAASQRPRPSRSGKIVTSSTPATDRLDSMECLLSLGIITFLRYFRNPFGRWSNPFRSLPWIVKHDRWELILLEKCVG